MTSTSDSFGLQVYPQRPAPTAPAAIDRWIVEAVGRPFAAVPRRPKRLFASAVQRRARTLQGLSHPELRQETVLVAQNLRRTPGNPHMRDLVRAFAIIVETADRALGIRAYNVQIMTARAVFDGTVAEMQTGEGKTLAGALAAGVAALAGIRVHVITANDYLAQRDAEKMRPFYNALGVSVAAMDTEGAPESRWRAYDAEVTYASGKEVAFDHLRDRVRMGHVAGDTSLRVSRYLDSGGFTLKGLQMAIVDEADSVMIDEARTPLILSAADEDAETEALATRVAASVAEDMTERHHFTLEPATRKVTLTNAGRAVCEQVAHDFPLSWQPRPKREEAVRLALAALHLHSRGDQYVVRDGKVEIVDEYTGRIMPDRSWSFGLHQAVEAKEGCEITARRETLAQITYQRFFRRYIRLGGMTGTAQEAAAEFGLVYGLPVTRIPTHRKNRRRDLGTRVEATQDAKWQRVALRSQELAASGRAVLIGTRSVAASEAASKALVQFNVQHEVLSATQDEEEAKIIARAGASGAVTVATNMAGRGTDILLDPETADAGGLAVIMTERHTARRIDRQLAGRAGRQGDPGSVETVLAADDPLLQEFGGRRVGLASLTRKVSAATFDRAQRRAEAQHASARRKLLKLDERMADSLAFAGRPE